MVNFPLMGYITKNGATIHELQEKSPVSGKRKKRLLLETEKNKNRKLKSFQKLLEWMSQSH